MSSYFRSRRLRKTEKSLNEKKTNSLRFGKRIDQLVKDASEKFVKLTLNQHNWLSIQKSKAKSMLQKRLASRFQLRDQRTEKTDGNLLKRSVRLVSSSKCLKSSKQKLKGLQRWQPCAKTVSHVPKTCLKQTHICSLTSSIELSSKHNMHRKCSMIRAELKTRKSMSSKMLQNKFKFCSQMFQKISNILKIIKSTKIS